MKERKVVPASAEGVPAGKAYAWVKNDSGNMMFGYVTYDSLSEALDDVGTLLLETKGRSVVVNYKDPDGVQLHIYELKHIASFGKNEPIDWSWLNPKNWFRKNGS